MLRPLRLGKFHPFRHAEATIFVSDTYNTLAGEFSADATSGAAGRARHKGGRGVKRFLPYVLLFMLVFAGLVSVAVMNPVETRRFLISADIFGWSDEARQESMRIARISALTELEDWQREALKHRQVFKQATLEMTKMALGSPSDELRIRNTNGAEPLTLLVYLFDDSARYTGLWYDRGHLFASQQLARPDVDQWRQQALLVAPSSESLIPLAAQSIH